MTSSATAVLTFSDDFNNLSLWNGSQGTWETSYYWQGTANGSRFPGEQEWYIDSRYAPTSSVKPWTVKDGVLTITATATDPSIASLVNNSAYTSGQLNTAHSFSQTYGYFEIRAQMPAGKGAWPAFWLVNADMTNSYELDVMEMIGQDPTKLITTLHDNTSSGMTTGQSAFLTDMTAGFHTYGVDWTKDDITWYFDGVPVYKIATPAGMNTPMFMILNLAIGGPMPGDVDPSQFKTAQLLVDYVHVYSSKPDDSVLNAVSGVTASAKTAVASALTKAVSTVMGTDGDDLYLYGTSGVDEIYGGKGNDGIYGGAGNDKWLSGGDGNDRIYGGDGDDGITGDNGDDTLYGDGGVDEIYGGMGNDVIYGGAGNDKWLSGGDGNDRIYGGDGDDVISGDNGADTLSGDGGADSIFGGAGDDLIYGGDGADTWLSGGDGADTIYGGAGNDTLSGGAGSDTLNGDAGDDLLYGDAGDDIINAGNGNDYCAGGDGNDTLNGEGGDDVLYGEAGDDIINAGNGNDYLSGGDGNDRLYASFGDDTMDGGAGNDRFFGNEGADKMTGGAGNDAFVYTSALSDTTVARPDTIMDLSAGDTIDVRAFDANTLVSGDQAFQIVTAFSNKPAELLISYDAGANITTASFDVNGDGKADAMLLLVGNQTNFSGWLL
ncbi:family 16 glycosylhydrolase [Caulobacter sp.]|uniref:family 16 glycosylhydrolase n=1 Tax=Caulobacter sp. TaxID=78 RepID=UPI003BA91947